MQKPNGVKITVMKTMKHEDVFGGRLSQVADSMASVCERHKEGQIFMIDGNGQKPADFCTRAWHDITPDIAVLRFGGNFPWMKEKGINIVCCSDGARPVIFKLERID